MVDADGQVRFVDVPQQLEDVFGKEPGVGEDQGGPIALDRFVKLRDRPSSGMTAPGDAAFHGQQDLDLGRRTCFPGDEIDGRSIAMRGEPCAKRIGIGHRCRKPNPPHLRSQRLQASQRKRQQIAPLAGGKGMDFIDDDPLQRPEQFRRFGIAEQQRERFRRRQQDVRRAGSLAGLAVGRCIAAPGLDPQRQAHLFDGGQEIALNVMRKGFQRRDIECVQAFGRQFSRQSGRSKGAQGRQEPGKSLARAGIGHQQRVATGSGRAQHVALMAPDPPAARSEPICDLWPVSDFGTGVCGLSHGFRNLASGQSKSHR